MNKVDEIAALEAELAARSTAAPAQARDNEDAAARIAARIEDRRRVVLEQMLVERRRLDDLTMRQAAERRERAAWLSEHFYWSE